jgi:DNA-binding transcriptional regulator LsrR (DeoR family)
LDAHFNDFQKARVISQVLTYYYIEGKNQADIAKHLEISTTKVNSLIKEAREQKLIEVSLKLPFQNLIRLTNRLKAVSKIQEAIIVPKLSINPETILHSTAKAAADLLLERLRDGDTLCVGSGKTLYAITELISPKRKYKIKVVPCVGGVQGRHYFDVNHIAAKLARKLGGKSYQFQAPLFVDSEKDRTTLHNMRQNKEVLDLARNAQIALHGIGGVQLKSVGHFETLYDFIEEKGKQDIVQKKGSIGEILAHAIDENGKECAESRDHKIVGITLEELKKIPLDIAVSATGEKAFPIYAALKGDHIRNLVSDEIAITQVVDLLEGSD